MDEGTAESSADAGRLTNYAIFALMFLAGLLTGLLVDWSSFGSSNPEDAAAECVLRNSARLSVQGDRRNPSLGWLIAQCERNPNLRAR
jgi:hypothetical protein